MGSTIKNSVISVSICICTYNRSKKLKRLLTHLCDHLDFPEGIDVDVICVDNNSNDDTQQVALSFREKLPLTIVQETEQGLSNARNRAISLSKAEWLIFIDDDVIPEENWLGAYASAIEDANVDFIGGRILLNWITPKPNWLIDEDLDLLSGVLGKFDLGENSLPFSDTDNSATVSVLPCGANFAATRKLLSKTGKFNTLLGVVGGTPGRAEETEYFGRAQRLGFRGIYCADALCFHDALVGRLNKGYMLSHGIQKGRAEFEIGNTPRIAIYSEPMLWLKAFFQLLKGRRDRYLQTVINIGMRRGFLAAKRGAQ